MEKSGITDEVNKIIEEAYNLSDELLYTVVDKKLTKLKALLKKAKEPNLSSPQAQAWVDVNKEELLHELFKALRWAIAELETLNDETHQLQQIEQQLPFAKEQMSNYRKLYPLTRST